MIQKSKTQKLGNKTRVGKWHCDVGSLLTPSGLIVTDKIYQKTKKRKKRELQFINLFSVGTIILLLTVGFYPCYIFTVSNKHW